MMHFTSITRRHAAAGAKDDGEEEGVGKDARAADNSGESRQSG